MYNDKYIKAKICLYNVNLYFNKIPKENEHYTSSSVLLLDSVISLDNNIIHKYF